MLLQKEHVRNVKLCSKGSNISNHVDHQIDLENANQKGDYQL